MCLFCAKLGHDLDTCVDKVRVQRLQRDPKYKDRADLRQMSTNRARPWINNQSLVPNPERSREGTRRRERETENFNSQTEEGAQNSGPGEAAPNRGVPKNWWGVVIRDLNPNKTQKGLEIDLNLTGQQKNEKGKGKGLKTRFFLQYGSLKRYG